MRSRVKIEIADAEFIAHARTDIPEMIAEVERLTARLQESPYGDDKIDELEEACDNLRFQVESRDQQIATLKKALELACRKIADYLGYENLESAGVNSIAAGAKSLMEIFSQQAQEQEADHA